MITAASAGYSATLPTPKVLSGSELASLAMPVYIALGGKSPITGKRAQARARSVPAATVEIYQGATHSLPMEYPEEVGRALNAFWEEHE